MKFKLTEEFNDLINDCMDGDNEPPLSGPILNENVVNYTSFLMKEGDNLLNEVFSRKSDLKKHYLKHVLAQDEKRTSDNRTKYDYITKQEYRDYAKLLRDSNPDFVIDSSITELSDAMDIVDEFIKSPSGILKVDYPGMKNDINNHSVVAIYNKNSKYSTHMDFCLIDKTDNDIITLYPLRSLQFYTHMNKFLQPQSA